MNKTRKLTHLALFLTTALILSYVESLIPFPIPIPGIKLGLPNIVTILGLNLMGLPATLILVVARVFISGFMFGSMSAILYALSGGLLSCLTMALLLILNKKKQRLSMPMISVLGAIAHNIGQLIVAACVINNIQLMLYYLPYLVLLAIPTGLFIGFVANLLLPRAKKLTAFQK